MRPEIQLVLFATLLSFTLTYAWWIRFRVWMLREDLFDIRDTLWDTMQAAGQLDDPEHRRVRDEINALIRVAPLISMGTVIRGLFEAENWDPIEPCCVCPPVQQARGESLRRVSQYVLFQTILGLTICAVFAAIMIGTRLPSRALREKLAAFMNRTSWLMRIRDESREMEDMASSGLSNI